MDVLDGGAGSVIIDLIGRECKGTTTILVDSGTGTTTVGIALGVG